MHRNPTRALRRRRVLIAAGLLLGCVPPAVACTVTSSPLVFGQIDPLAGQPVASVATIDISGCPASQPYSIALSTDAGGNRQMSGGEATLAYQLYTDASHTVVWGDGLNGTQPVAGQADAQGSSSHDVYGHVPAQPYARPGNYSDTLLITVTW